MASREGKIAMVLAGGGMPGVEAEPAAPLLAKGTIRSAPGVRAMIGP